VWLKNTLFTEKDAKGLSPGRKNECEVKAEAKFKSFGASLNFEEINMQGTFGGLKKDEGPKLVPGQFPDDPPKKKKKPRKHY